jgi:hypothetical protein
LFQFGSAALLIAPLAGRILKGREFDLPISVQHSAVILQFIGRGIPLLFGA